MILPNWINSKCNSIHINSTPIFIKQRSYTSCNLKINPLQTRPTINEYQSHVSIRPLLEKLKFHFEPFRADVSPLSSHLAVTSAFLWRDLLKFQLHHWQRRSIPRQTFHLYSDFRFPFARLPQSFVSPFPSTIYIFIISAHARHFQFSLRQLANAIFSYVRACVRIRRM